MANQPSDQSAGGAAAMRSLVERLRSLVAWLKTNPVRGGLYIAIGLLVIGGLAAATSALLPDPPKSAKELLKEAFVHLDAGNYKEARRLAGQSRTAPGAASPADGATLLVLGTALAADARQDLNPTQRRTLSLIAARYLEEARFQGVPKGRETDARLLLGRCLHDGERYAAAIPVLRDLQIEDPQQLQLVHQLLADCYLRIDPPALDKALVENQKLLASPGLSKHEQELARLQQAEILMQQKQWDEAQTALAAIPESSTVHATATLLTARVALRDVRQQALQDGPTDPDFSAQCEALLAELQRLQESDSAAPDVVAQAQLLSALCLLGQKQETAALTQLSRVRRAFAGRPEALVAMLFEAEMLQEDGDATASLALYERLLHEAGSADAYHNPLLPLKELDARLTQAFDLYLAKNDYSEAATLAEATGPLLSEVRRCELLARAHRAWGQHLVKTAPEELAPRKVTEAEARDHFREAAAQMEKLAQLRIATRHYLDDLAASAQYYLEGHGFRQAVRVYRTLLRQAPSNLRPAALSGLGEALLSMGDPAAALRELNECCEMYPNHPATYHARFLAAQALEEQGKTAEAKQLLSDNLYKYSLTPQSADWRDSLFALGNLIYREAILYEARSRAEGVDSDDLDRRRSALIVLDQAHSLFRESLKILSEAVKRYPEAPQSIEARYRIAECYRHAAKWPRKRLSIITIETTRVSLHRQMQQDLQAAVEAYSQLISLLGDDKEPYRSPLERSILRNAYFARGDALFDLGRYDDAIKAYSAATNRFQHEPEALEAYVQIAACYRRLNRPVEARGTLEQARVVLSRIKSDADFLRTTCNTREQWSELLNWLATL